MSADSLYHAFGLKGYSVHAIRRENNEIVLETRQPRESFRCSQCGSAHVFSQGRTKRRFRTLPIGTQTVIIELAVPRGPLPRLLDRATGEDSLRSRQSPLHQRL